MKISEESVCLPSVKSFLRLLELMEPINGLWNIRNDVSSNADWQDAKITELTKSNELGILLPSTFYYDMYSSKEYRSCVVGFLKSQ